MFARKIIPFVAGLLWLAATCQSVWSADADTSRPEAIYSQLLRSTAFVESPDGSGTAWVADRDRGLLVTNYHVVARDSGYGLYDKVLVAFPAYRNGREIAEKSYYKEHERELVAKGRIIEAKVIDALERCDLAVLQVSKLPADILALPLAVESPRGGSRLYAIGNPGGEALWLYCGGAVKQVSQETWGSKMGHRILHQRARVAITQSPANPGDSGGPIVNDAGELVAVTQGKSEKSTLINSAIDVSEVRAYLADVDWMTRMRTAADFYRRANYYYPDAYFDPPEERHNRSKLALADLDRAIRLEPDHAAYYLDRARVHEGLGTQHWKSPLDTLLGRSQEAPRDYALALSDCNKAIALRGGYAPAYARRASIGLAMANDVPRAFRESAMDTALTDAKHALDLDPDCVAAYEVMATHYAFAPNSRDKALACYDEIIRRQPANAGALAARSFVYQRMKNYAAARKDLDKAIELQPESTQFHVSRALLDIGEGRIDQAVKDRRAVVELRPDDPWNWRLLAESLARTGKTDEAIGAYTQALKIIAMLDLAFADPSGILLARADLYAAQGDSEHAKIDYQAALRVEKPAAEFARKVQDRLNRVSRY